MVGGGSWRVVKMAVKERDYQDHRNGRKVSRVRLRVVKCCTDRGKIYFAHQRGKNETSRNPL